MKTYQEDRLNAKDNRLNSRDNSEPRANQVNHSGTAAEIKSTVNDLKSAFHNKDQAAFDAQVKLIEEKLDTIK